MPPVRLRLHRAVVAHLTRDSDRVLAQARATLDRRLSRANHPGSPAACYRRWQELIEQGVETVASILLIPQKRRPRCARAARSPV